LAKNNFKLGKVSKKTLRQSIKYQSIGNSAIRKAQEENRRLGIPNWYSINGEIISDIELKARNRTK
jgi:hypothetical protein